MNKTMIQYFHWYTKGEGILWNELNEKAEWLASIGITGAWLPPAYKAAAGSNSVGYDVYDLYDLGEFDQKGSVKTKYGSKEEYKNAVKSLQKNNIEVIIDIVLNHKGGGDETEKFMAVRVDSEDRNKILSEPEEIEAFTKFTFPARGKKYSEFIWTQQCFTGVDYNHLKEETAIFSIQNEWGNDWEEMIDIEKGNYDYLMFNDIEFRNPAVRDELNRWIMWHMEEIPFDAVRLDAVKHISPKFYNEWLHHLREKSGKEIFAVGEYWAPGLLPLLFKYIEATEGSMSLFDSCLQNNFHIASKEGSEYDLRNIFNETLTQALPEKSVTLVDNHDTQPLQALEAPVEKWFKAIAYALILLRQEGYPCIFYPDLFGANYKDSKEDGNENEIFLDKVEELDILLKVRKNYAYGFQRDYFDDPNCIGWTREGDDENSGCAVLISNAEANSKSMEIGKKYAGKTFVDILKKQAEEIIVSDEGWIDCKVLAGSVSVWVEKEKLCL
jgi:alpha-amylase